MAFRGFRLVVGLILTMVSLWLIVDGGKDIMAAGSIGSAVSPALTVVAALFILAAYWYALWAESAIHKHLENIFAIPELIRKIVFTLALLCIYRIGFHVPLAGVNQPALFEKMGLQGGDAEGGMGQAIQYFSMFTGGSLQQSSLFGLGIMPYISASIIFQLLTTVVPALEKLQKEGPAGYKKIQEYTRYATVGLCLVQAIFLMQWMKGNGLLYPEYGNSTIVVLMGVAALTAGTIFLMWLGEQIDEYGIGNGISLLIMAGIVSRMPGAISDLADLATPSLIGQGQGEVGVLQILTLIGLFVSVVAGAILITQGQRRIPIQQAKQVRGRRVTGGQRHYMPLRVNQGGVMPIIFASSLMIFPAVIFGWLSKTWPNVGVLRAIESAFSQSSFIYTVVNILLIFFFAYFWTTIQFKPKETAEQLRDMGHFIPGLRPGKRTADYLERVMERITYCGAAFLALIAILPMIVGDMLDIPRNISAFLGGTGLLIVISVALDLVQRIEANLVMRNYGGFLGGSARIKGSR